MSASLSVFIKKSIEKMRDRAVIFHGNFISWLTKEIFIFSIPLINRQMDGHTKKVRHIFLKMERMTTSELDL